MRVGIFTFHYCYNYGAVLQCLALCQTIRRMGHEVNVIDYRPLPRPVLRLWQGWGLRKNNPLRNIRWRWNTLRFTTRMLDNFDQFTRSQLRFSPPCDAATVATIARSYDVLITGSDQVWNCADTKVSPMYFLHFPGQDRVRRVSYAACCGHGALPAETLRTAVGALAGFQAISVRNQATHDWLKKLTGLEAEIVCDPTLLSDENLLQPSDSRANPPYLLIYTLGAEIAGGTRSAIAEIKRTHGQLSVVWICPAIARPSQTCYWADHVVRGAGPTEWLQWMANASFIYTDSFHGALFAMKLHKSFFAFYREPSRAPRLLDIGQRYGVGSVIAGSLAEARDRNCFAQQIDYDTVAQRIRTHRRSSLAFLEDSLR